MGQEHASIAVAFMLQLGPLAMLFSPFISDARAAEAAMVRAALRKIRRFIAPPLGVEVLCSSRGRRRRADPCDQPSFLSPLPARRTREANRLRCPGYWEGTMAG